MHSKEGFAVSKTLRANFGCFAIVFTLATFFVSTGVGNLFGQSMSVPRKWATSTELNDGRVLVAGGQNGGSGGQSSADVFTAGVGTAAGQFLPTGPMTTPRYQHTASLLHDGRVLVTGGYPPPGVSLATAEIYDPATGLFTATGSMSGVRAAHRAAVLPDGRVLVAGGVDGTGVSLATAEIYDPTTGKFTPTGSMHGSRFYYSMVALNNGQVLVAGGYTGRNGGANSTLSTAELYDPAAGVFTSTGPMTVQRIYFTATLLNGGKVLVAGGDNNNLASAEVYDPGSGTFTATGAMVLVRYQHTATLLTSGQVLIAGGNGTDKRSELYDPASGTFSARTALQESRAAGTATLLSNGSVLVAGGTTDNSAEIYWPAVVTPAGLTSIAVSAVQGTATAGQNPTQTYQAMGTYVGGSTQIMQGVVWSTANPTVATISNDQSDRGVAIETTLGSTNVTACAGTIWTCPHF